MLPGATGPAAKRHFELTAQDREFLREKNQQTLTTIGEKRFFDVGEKIVVKLRNAGGEASMGIRDAKAYSGGPEARKAELGVYV